MAPGEYFPKEVSLALAGFHTQWCIAGEGTAAGYLADSDLHIYFSKDEHDEDAIPRACIVDSKQQGITEVRGIINDELAKQHLDDYVTPEVDEHLSGMEGGKKWRETMLNMKQLAALHMKHLQREPLSSVDLRFLNQIDRPIQSTGYDDDPRIAEIIAGRDIKDDLSQVLNIPKAEISRTKEEALSGNIAFHYGTLNLRNLTSAEGLTLPREIGSDLELHNLTSAEGLTLPEKVGRFVMFNRLPRNDIDSLKANYPHLRIAA